MKLFIKSINLSHFWYLRADSSTFLTIIRVQTHSQLPSQAPLGEQLTDLVRRFSGALHIKFLYNPSSINENQLKGQWDKAAAGKKKGRIQTFYQSILY